MQPCACRDCFDLTAGESGSLCWECEEAGCIPGDDLVERHDCQRGDAYQSDAEWERENDLYNRYDRIGKKRPS